MVYHFGRKHSSLWLGAVAFCICFSGKSRAATVSPLSARGYCVLPEPQHASLGLKDFQLDRSWQLRLGKGVQATDVAVETLRDELHSRFGLALGVEGKARAVARLLSLAVTPNSVSIGEATDRNKEALAEQAYKIDLATDSIAITANAPTGLFYGVETFVQLLRAHEGLLRLPVGKIIDWPDLENRFIYWDDKGHLDRFDVLKDVIRRAAFFKVNGIMIKLNGHFQFASAPAVVEPYALSPGELQQLTDYGLHYHIQLIPYVDAPAHIAWILKHPEHASLREFPESNYELCTTNPDSYKLLEGMYQDLLNANKGVKYFLLSTDEPYYVGLAQNAQCNEVDRAKELGSVGKLLAEFITKTAGYLHDRGRAVIFWGEYPLILADIPSLPSYLINGEVYGQDFDKAFKAHGIRQMIFTNAEASEPLFPNYFLLPGEEQVYHHPVTQADEAHFRPERDRISEMFNEISFWPARQDADLIGVDVCAWGDEGLHPETFWLGFATSAAWIWHPGSPDPREAMSSFYQLFYGQGAFDMDRLYQLMSSQAEFWDSSWEWAPSSARSLKFGNSDRIGPIVPRDQVLSLPPIPQGPYLRQEYDWGELNARRLRLVQQSLAQKDELLGLLHKNLRSVQFNPYNLEVYLSIAELCRHNLEMLEELGEINNSLKAAQAAAARLEYDQAVARLDQALALAEIIRGERNRALSDAAATWYKSWFPRVAEANGRRYLHVLNDVQDYRVDRELGLKYLIERELLLPFGEWFNQVQEVRNRYATAHWIPARNLQFDWKATTSTSAGQAHGKD